MRTTRFWVILFAALLLCSAAGMLALSGLQFGDSATTAVIYADGFLLETVDLSALQSPMEFYYTGNTIVADSSGIRITHADCPDQLCVRQGTITNGLVPLVCLPNRLVIQIESAAPSPFDGVSS